MKPRIACCIPRSVLFGTVLAGVAWVGGADTTLAAPSGGRPAADRAAAAADAQDPGEAAAAAEDAEPAAADDGDEEDDGRELDVKGRVFVRNTVLRAGWENRLGIDSARLGAVYRDRAYGLRVEVDVEFGEGEAEIRDAHIRFRLDRRVRVQAGRFKRPVSAISLTSRWDLPIIERGPLDELRVPTAFTNQDDELPLGGRAVGATVNLRDRKLPLEPDLTVGVFRSPVHAQIRGAIGMVNRAPVGWTEGFPEDLFVRLEVEPDGGIDVGATFAWLGQLAIEGDRDSHRRGYLAGLDVHLDETLAGWLPVAAWVEGFAGTNPLHITPSADASGRFEASGRFTAARAIVTVRLQVAPGHYLEPYTTAQVLDVSDEVDEDRVVRLSGGLNYGFGERWRIQTAVDWARADGQSLYADHTQFLVQLGAVF